MSVPLQDKPGPRAARPSKRTTPRKPARPETRRIDLPSGAWVVVRNMDAVPEKLIRPIRHVVAQINPDTLAAIGAASGPDASDEDAEAIARAVIGPDLELLERSNDLTAAALIVEWSFDAPCPPSEDDITDLPSADYEALITATAADTAELVGDRVNHAP